MAVSAGAGCEILGSCTEGKRGSRLLGARDGAAGCSGEDAVGREMLGMPESDLLWMGGGSFGRLWDSPAPGALGWMPDGCLGALDSR